MTLIEIARRLLDVFAVVIVLWCAWGAWVGFMRSRPSRWETLFVATFLAVLMALMLGAILW